MHISRDRAARRRVVFISSPKCKVMCLPFSCGSREWVYIGMKTSESPRLPFYAFQFHWCARDVSAPFCSAPVGAEALLAHQGSAPHSCRGAGFLSTPTAPTRRWGPSRRLEPLPASSRVYGPPVKMSAHERRDPQPLSKRSMQESVNSENR
jgi:hypothetical protein